MELGWNSVGTQLGQVRAVVINTKDDYQYRKKQMELGHTFKKSRDAAGKLEIVLLQALSASDVYQIRGAMDGYKAAVENDKVNRVNDHTTDVVQTDGTATRKQAAEHHKAQMSELRQIRVALTPTAKAAAKSVAKSHAETMKLIASAARTVQAEAKALAVKPSARALESRQAKLHELRCATEAADEAAHDSIVLFVTTFPTETALIDTLSFAAAKLSPSSIGSVAIVIAGTRSSVAAASSGA